MGVVRPSYEMHSHRIDGLDSLAGYAVKIVHVDTVEKQGRIFRIPRQIRAGVCGCRTSLEVSMRAGRKLQESQLSFGLVRRALFKDFEPLDRINVSSHLGVSTNLSGRVLRVTSNRLHCVLVLSSCRVFWRQSTPFGMYI